MRSYIVTHHYVTEEVWRIAAPTKSEAIKMAADYIGGNYQDLPDDSGVEVITDGGIITHYRYTAKLER